MQGGESGFYGEGMAGIRTAYTLFYSMLTSVFLHNKIIMIQNIFHSKPRVRDMQTRDV